MSEGPATSQRQGEQPGAYDPNANSIAARFKRFRESGRPEGHQEGVIKRGLQALRLRSMAPVNGYGQPPKDADHRFRCSPPIVMTGAPKKGLPRFVWDSGPGTVGRRIATTSSQLLGSSVYTSFGFVVQIVDDGINGGFKFYVMDLLGGNIGRFLDPDHVLNDKRSPEEIAFDNENPHLVYQRAERFIAQIEAQLNTRERWESIPEADRIQYQKDFAQWQMRSVEGDEAHDAGLFEARTMIPKPEMDAWRRTLRNSSAWRRYDPEYEGGKFTGTWTYGGEVPDHLPAMRPRQLENFAEGGLATEVRDPIVREGIYRNQGLN